MVEYDILESGPAFEVRAVQRRQKDMSEVSEFLLGLSPASEMKVTARIEMLAQRGPTRDREKFRSIKGESNLFEIKVGQVRIMAFYAGKGIAVLTHGFIKKGDATPKQQIERALNLRAEYERAFGCGSNQKTR